MADKDVLLAVLGSDIAIAGLVLVFSGFLFTKAESFGGSRSGDKYSYLSVAGLIPVVAALAAAWMCIDGIQGGQWEAEHALIALKIVIALTAAYAIIAGTLTFFP